MSKQVTLAVLGAGSRGRSYANYAVNNPDKLKIVAVAEPNAVVRERFAKLHNLPEDRCFESWEDFCKQPKMCDGVIIGTQDNMHEGPAVACADLKYHILLEKPMAPTAEACRNIVAAVKKNNVMFGVCHVLRYTKYTQALKEILDSGEIGDIVSVQHLEPVGYWHQAHSFVRGNWRNEKESSFMLLAKSCHDVDWLHYVIGKKCVDIQSFGSLFHFKKSEQPAGAADRCVDCPQDVESLCPYSAYKIYFRDRFAGGNLNWPTNVLTNGPVTRENLTEALKTGPYGRCVYACDNDVVDNQTVNMLFEDGSTATMTMTAFNYGHQGRFTRIFGTMGEIEGNSQVITIRKFVNNSTRIVDTNIANDGGILTGHGGGDLGLIESFVEAVATGDQSKILSGVDETLSSHLMVFAAEQSRRERQVKRVE